MVDDNVSCNSEGKNLKGVCGSEVDKHAYELKADNDGTYGFEKIGINKLLDICVITLYNDYNSEI